MQASPFMDDLLFLNSAVAVPHIPTELLDSLEKTTARLHAELAVTRATSALVANLGKDRTLVETVEMTTAELQDEMTRSMAEIAQPPTQSRFNRKLVEDLAKDNDRLIIEYRRMLAQTSQLEKERDLLLDRVKNFEGHVPKHIREHCEAMDAEVRKSRLVYEHTHKRFVELTKGIKQDLSDAIGPAIKSSCNPTLREHGLTLPPVTSSPNDLVDPAEEALTNPAIDPGQCKYALLMRPYLYMSFSEQKNYKAKRQMSLRGSKRTKENPELYSRVNRIKKMTGTSTEDDEDRDRIERRRLRELQQGFQSVGVNTLDRKASAMSLPSLR
jgi:hypothetical protein